MDTNTDLVAAAHETLVTSIEGMIESNGWKDHLKVQAAFHSYSFGNVIWLFCQAASRGVMPSRFAGFNAWKKVGRSVQKGAKSFKVLAPVLVPRKTEDETAEKQYVMRGFKVVSTFEMSQTEGRDLPVMARKLEGTSEEILAAYAKLTAFATKRGWTVQKTDTGIANGVCKMTEKAIEISQTLSDLQSLKTLCHEVAHSMLHADELGSHATDVREVEAESVAFVTLSALGFDSADYSFGYVATWSQGNVDLVKKTGERVQRAAKTILEALGAKGEDAAE